jgi:CBS domain-containing protein
MIANSLIQPEYPTVKLTDSTNYVLDLMTEYKVSHLPVVDKTKHLIGIVSEEDVLENNVPKIGESKIIFARVYTKATHHIYEVLKIVSDYKLSLIPVIDEEEKYIGSISLSILTQQFAKLTSLQNAGGIIVLELSINDYSMAEVAQITEANGAKIVSSYITPHTDSTKLELTIKLNETDLTRVIKAFIRFEYVIQASFHESEFIDELKDRYDNFMRYLNI